MSQLGCRCGERMTKTDCPSPCSLDIFYEEEVERAVLADPTIALHSFLSGWDEKNDCPKEYKDRLEPVDYWYCPTCKRVYEVQYRPHGRWLRIYKRVQIADSGDISGWRQIYVLPDVETDRATEEDWDILLDSNFGEVGDFSRISAALSLGCGLFLLQAADDNRTGWPEQQPHLQ